MTPYPREPDTTTMSARKRRSSPRQPPHLQKKGVTGAKHPFADKLNADLALTTRWMGGHGVLTNEITIFRHHRPRQIRCSRTNVSSKSCPYKFIPASSRSVSRAPRPMGEAPLGGAIATAPRLHCVNDAFKPALTGVTRSGKHRAFTLEK